MQVQSETHKLATDLLTTDSLNLVGLELRTLRSSASPPYVLIASHKLFASNSLLKKSCCQKSASLLTGVANSGYDVHDGCDGYCNHYGEEGDSNDSQCDPSFKLLGHN